MGLGLGLIAWRVSWSPALILCGFWILYVILRRLSPPLARRSVERDWPCRCRDSLPDVNCHSVGGLHTILAYAFRVGFSSNAHRTMEYLGQFVMRSVPRKKPKQMENLWVSYVALSHIR